VNECKPLPSASAAFPCAFITGSVSLYKMLRSHSGENGVRAASPGACESKVRTRTLVGTRGATWRAIFSGKATLCHVVNPCSPRGEPVLDTSSTM